MLMRRSRLKQEKERQEKLAKLKHMRAEDPKPKSEPKAQPNPEPQGPQIKGEKVLFEEQAAAKPEAKIEKPQEASTEAKPRRRGRPKKS